MPKSVRDLGEIYSYLAIEKEIPDTALNLVDDLEKAILSLALAKKYEKSCKPL